MGVFLYGTYLFIQASMDGKKTYIKSINNYLAEYQDWYLDAMEKVKQNLSEDLFGRPKNAENVMNIVYNMGSIFSKYKDVLIDISDTEHKKDLTYPLQKVGDLVNGYTRGDFIIVGGKKTSGKSSFCVE